MTAPLIHQPGLQGRLRRGLFAALTVGAWVGWAALWLPLWNLVRDGLCHGRWLPAWAQPVHVGSVVSLLVLALAAGLALSLWASYNYWRFAHLGRRKANTAAVPLHEAAARLDASEAVAQALRHHRQVVVHFNHAGRAEWAQAERALPPESPID